MSRRGLALFCWMNPSIDQSRELVDRLIDPSPPPLSNTRVVEPSDRFSYYSGLLKLQYGKRPLKLGNFFKVRK